jgi:hypothetical protein
MSLHFTSNANPTLSQTLWKSLDDRAFEDLTSNGLSFQLSFRIFPNLDTLFFFQLASFADPGAAIGRHQVKLTAERKIE